MYGRSRNLEFTIVDSCLVQTKTHSQIESLARQLLCDVIGHDNQSQHYPNHGYLCLELSGRITTPGGFSYYTGRRRSCSHVQENNDLGNASDNLAILRLEYAMLSVGLCNKGFPKQRQNFHIYCG